MFFESTKKSQISVIFASNVHLLIGLWHLADMHRCSGCHRPVVFVLCRERDLSKPVRRLSAEEERKSVIEHLNLFTLQHKCMKKKEEAKTGK